MLGYLAQKPPFLNCAVVSLHYFKIVQIAKKRGTNVSRISLFKCWAFIFYKDYRTELLVRKMKKKELGLCRVQSPSVWITSTAALMFELLLPSRHT